MMQQRALLSHTVRRTRQPPVVNNAILSTHASHNNTILNHHHQHNQQQQQQQMQQMQGNAQQVRHYNPLPNPPADPLPWKSYTTRVENLHTVVYNPMGKSMKPPMPLLVLPGMTETHHMFSNIARHMNYPYGVVGMDMRGRGKSNNDVSMKRVLSSEELAKRPCGDLFQHVKDVIHVLNEYHLYRAIMVGSDFGALVAYWVAKLYPDRCNGIIMLNSGFTSGKFSKVEEALRAEIDIVANKQHSDANAYFRELTGMKDASLDQLPLNGQERFKYEYANRPDSALLGRDLAAMKKYLNSMDEMMKVRHPILTVRSEHGFTENSPALVDSQTSSDFEKSMNVKDSYFAKGATHHSMLWDESHCKAIAEKIDNFMGRYDTHRRIEKDFEELKNYEE